MEQHELQALLAGKRILRLNLKKKWFDMIARGIKKEEYRELKPYWAKLATEKYDIIEFAHAYNTVRPIMYVELSHITIGGAVPEWSDNAVGNYYVLVLGNILSILNYEL